MMGYPLRTDEHIKETASVKALICSLPDHWIIRHLTERDYGLDCIMEIPTKTAKGYELTGRMLGVQLKSDSTLKWIDDEKFIQKSTVSGIKTTSAGYWFGLPFPVFLFVHDQISKHLYFSPIKLQLRRQYEKFQTQDSVSFYLYQEMCLDKPVGLGLLISLYALESAYTEFAQVIRDFLVSCEQYTRFIRKHIYRDVHLELDYSDEVTFFAIYKKCRTILACRMITADLPTNKEIWDHNEEAFPKSGHIHEYTASWALKKLIPIFIDITTKHIPAVIKSEESFWQQTEPLLYRAYLVEWDNYVVKHLTEELSQSLKY